MLRSFAALLVWPIITLWLAVVPQTWRTLVVPSDDPRAEAMGPDPDRVLLLGSGKSAGVGVHTHELGLGGHLARELAALTKRGCSVDIVSDPTMSAADTGVVVRWARLDKFDALVLTLGGADTIRLRSLFAWRRDVTALLEIIEENGGGGALRSFIVGIAPADGLLSLPAPLLRMVNINIANLNTITGRICAERPGVTFVPVTSPTGSTFAPFESRTYEHWARELAPSIAEHLARVAVPPPPGLTAAERYMPFDGSALTAKPVSTRLNEIADSARSLLNTSGAAITFHDEHPHWFTSASGVGNMERDEAGIFCSAVFMAHGLVVCEDTFHDESLCDHPWVVAGPRIRFCAGYPISASNGDAIGAVWVFDTEPRTFDSSHESLLRELALRAESVLQRQ